MHYFLVCSLNSLLIFRQCYRSTCNNPVFTCRDSILFVSFQSDLNCLKEIITNFISTMLDRVLGLVKTPRFSVLDFACYEPTVSVFFASLDGVHCYV